MADVIDVAKTKTKATLIIALIVAAAIVLILWAAGVFKSHNKSKSKFSASSGSITTGVRTSDPNNQQTNLVNHGVGSYAIHQASLATGGLFEHDIESVWQQAPMRTNLNRANAHCEPSEIEGTSFVNDVATGNLVRVVSCYDKSGIHVPKMPKITTTTPPMVSVLPGKKTKSKFEGFASGGSGEMEYFASSPSIDCNGVWDYGAEGELGSHVLMSNMVAYNSMGEDKLEHELLDME